jgi:hypothetical protein
MTKSTGQTPSIGNTILQATGEKLIPSGRDKRLASDKSVTVQGNARLV